MRLFGLIGFPLEHSFSSGYFTSKFERERIGDTSYLNFELESLRDLPDLLQRNQALEGFNVTIPFKKSIIPLIDRLDPVARKIGAVNCVRITRNNNNITSTGYNTDEEAFRKSLEPLLEAHHQKALLLGTGGSARAVAHALSALGIDFLFVSRNPLKKEQIGYSRISADMLQDYLLVVNATPVGMFPRIEELPPLPYDALNEKHLLYDLVYNPEVSRFLREGMKSNARIKNGMEMLTLQAELSWRIWNRFD